ncbi:MAG: DUF2202 domain-containing protein [Chloroflexota bacterium]
MKNIIITILILSVAVSACSSGADAAYTLNEEVDQSAAAALEIADEEVVAAISDNENNQVVEVHGFEEIDCPICEFDYSQYTGSLNEDEVQGLLIALNDEYRAWAIYNQVMLDFGMDTRPFSNIRSAESHHFDQLTALFAEYGIDIPDNPWIGNVPSFESVSAACAAGVDAEIENAALYDLIFSSTDREDITIVYEALQRASLDKHLPAFENCGGGNR